jgi:hypothetical protein
MYQIDNMTFPVLLHRCLLNLDTFEFCVWMIYDTFKSISAELLQMRQEVVILTG